MLLHKPTKNEEGDSPLFSSRNKMIMNVSFLVDDYHFNSRLANASFFNVLGRHIYSTWPSKKWKQQERERDFCDRIYSSPQIRGMQLSRWRSRPMIYESASLKELLPLPPFFAKTTWLLRSIERDKVPDQISFFSILAAAAVAAAAEMRCERTVRVTKWIA